MDGKRKFSGAAHITLMVAVVFLTIATPLHAEEAASISVSGQTLGWDFKPIPGVKVYLVSTWPHIKLLAETKSDAEGRYEFKNIAIVGTNVEAGGPSDEKYVWAAIEVFGQAEGHGFDWRSFDSQIIDQLKSDPKPDRAIAVNLIFPETCKLGGQIVDEDGKPIADAKVRIRFAGPFLGSDICNEDRINHFQGIRGAFNSLNGRGIVPTELTDRTSDNEGYFQFDCLPDQSFLLEVRQKDFAKQTVWASTRAGATDGNYKPLFTNGKNITLFKPIAVPVQVQYGDTSRPAAGVLVSGGNENCTFVETTDDQGRVTLQIPPGHYQASVLAALGSPYLSLDSMQQNAVEFDVDRKLPAAPLVYRLPPAAVVDVTMIDPITGAGVKGLKLWQSDPAMPLEHREIFYRSWEAATHVAHAHYPTTDADGKLRALFAPGQYRIGVGWPQVPDGYEVLEGNGQAVDLQPGEPTKLTFQVGKIR